MSKRMFAVAFAILTLVLSGCATREVVHIQAAALPEHDNVTFVDNRTSPSEPSFMFGRGLITSCHYGIDKIENGALDPDRMTLLHSYLDSKVLNDNKSHTVTITRFDIYWNQHAWDESLNFGALWSHGVLVGCKDAQEGEYYTSESPGPNYSPIVIYLDSVIDGQKYNVRTVYPLLQDSNVKSAWPGALTAAIDKTFATLGSLVTRDASVTPPH